jgi:hypothetical protein
MEESIAVARLKFINENRQRLEVESLMEYIQGYQDIFTQELPETHSI